MLVRLLEFGEAFSDQGQVALGSRGAGVSISKYAAKAPRCVIEEPLGKDEFVSRGSGALHDRNHVCVSQPEACVIRRNPFSSFRAILRPRINFLDGMKRPCVCGKTYTLKG